MRASISCLQGDDLARYTPTLVVSLSSLGIHIVDVALGSYHTVALSTKGNVYAWGYNANGQVRFYALVQGCVCDLCFGASHRVPLKAEGNANARGCQRNAQMCALYARVWERARVCVIPGRIKNGAEH